MQCTANTICTACGGSTYLDSIAGSGVNCVTNCSASDS